MACLLCIWLCSSASFIDLSSCKYYADEDSSAKMAKLEVPPGRLATGVVPSPGIGYPPLPTYGAMPPVYDPVHINRCYR